MFQMLTLLVSALVAVAGLMVVYYVVRFAVRDGVHDAHRRLDRERVRSQLGVGEERSPHSRP